MVNPKSLQNLKPAWSKDNPAPNAKGRLTGSRDKITKRMLTLLAEDFEKHGDDAICMWREQHLDKYMAAIMGLMPKEATLNINTTTALDELSVEQLAALADGLTVLAEQLEHGAEDAAPQAGECEPSQLH